MEPGYGKAGIQRWGRKSISMRLTRKRLVTGLVGLPLLCYGLMAIINPKPAAPAAEPSRKPTIEIIIDVNTPTASPSATFTPEATRTPFQTRTPASTLTDQSVTIAPSPTSSPTSSPSRTPAPHSTVAPATAAPTQAAPGGGDHTITNKTVDPPWWPCARGQIKGSQSKIYHLPTGQFYARTYDNVRCFNTAAEAQTAGFRASQR